MQRKDVKDYLAAETDGSFFDNMRKMERDLLAKSGDTEALAYLDEEEKRLAAEDDALDRAAEDDTLD